MSVLVNDPDFTLHVGDVTDALRGLPDESVHCVVTSPPYWGLRDYGTGSWDGGDPDCDHVAPKQPDRKFTNGRGENEGYAGSNLRAWTTRDGTTYRDVCGKCGATRTDQQLGLEATPDLFVARMVDVFREVRRVLRSDGTCWLNLGDSYAGSWGAQSRGTGHDSLDWYDGMSAKQIAAHPKRTNTGSWVNDHPTLKPKDLVGIPWRVAFALQADGWYLRSDIVWSKPNPMPESVTDRPTKAHEYVFLLTKGPRYFFDAEAVREPNTEASLRDYLSRGQISKSSGNGETSCGHGGAARVGLVANGRNVRSVWEIPTQPYPEAHFATFPEALPERCIRAGTSERGCCPECGAPWERETDVTQELLSGSKGRATQKVNDHNWEGVQARTRKHVATTGWGPSCACMGGVYHPDFGPVPCTVLDPFMGSGTTALVARRLGRRSIGIELNPDYAALCARRLQQLSLFAGGDAYVGESLGWPAPDGPPAKEPA